jgi:hypothetical protein
MLWDSWVKCYSKPASNLGREEYPTAVGGAVASVGALESAPQNRHVPKALGPGYDGNFSAYKLRTHLFEASYAFRLQKASAFL